MTRDQDARYAEVAAQWGAALQRIARTYEADPERRRDLLQDMHVTLWKSLRAYDGRCSMRTWVYRVASNVAATHVNRERRHRMDLVTLDTIEHVPADRDANAGIETENALARLYSLIHRLKAPDRQIITLYLEGLSAEEIAEVTALSPGAIATRVSRLKGLLARLFHETANV
ncbi:MAG: sigma-70 family RNA polymerase sigma factor [Alphaproteobacteria bacterium]|nr:sigma-70 family RNA polymerase sigma factor [Alphaproteobacteria bacterium]